jgi:hypothetical protein
MLGVFGELRLFLKDHPFKSWLIGWTTPYLLGVVSGLLGRMPSLRRDRYKAYLIKFCGISALSGFGVAAAVFILLILYWHGDAVSDILPYFVGFAIIYFIVIHLPMIYLPTVLKEKGFPLAKSWFARKLNDRGDV